MNHYHDKINDYFFKKNVHVIYNMLGNTPELVYSYVNNFSEFLSTNGIKRSHHYKLQCYKQLYNIDNRPKFTGFENYEKLDKNFRKFISPLINQSQFTPTLVIDHDQVKETGKSFKEVLKQNLKSIDKPLLYLSGGIDSELVAKAMMDAKVKFIPVIFNYVNDQGQTLNLFDFKYAYKFCQQHGLFPIAKSINIEKLWNSKEFQLLAIELGITSPQLVTHAYMVELMADEFKDYTHIFGGEVRFETDFISPETHKPANLVYLNKTLAASYGLYVDEDVFSPFATCKLNVTLATGSTSPGSTNWYLSFEEQFEGQTTNESWYTVTGTPSPTFYYSITSVSIGYSGDSTNTSYFPSAPTSYAPVTGGTIAYVSNSKPSTGNILGTFGLSIYGSASSGTVASTTFQIEATHAI